MILYPAIDIRRGHCVRLHQGDFDQETVYGDDPVAQAKAFEAAGAQWLHVVDLDAARGDGSNRHVVESIASAVSIPVQTGGGVRDGSLLEAGVARVVAGSIAVREPDLVRELVADYPGRVALGLDHWDGQVKVRGWEEEAGVTVEEVLGWYEGLPVGAVVVTDISRDATMQGPSLLALDTDIPVIASGGVGSLDDLETLRRAGFAGVIVGKAIYEGRFTVEEAIACAASA